MSRLLKLALAALLYQAAVLAAAPTVEVEALFTDAAVLKIDGERKTLRAGESWKGVTLISAYSRTATLEVDGRQQVVGLSRRIGSNYQEPESREVTITRNAKLQYATSAIINGKRIPVLVDTGANIVAMSLTHAAQLGLDHEAGQPGMVETAGGRVKAWVVTLRYVDVGGIRVDNVKATVVDGEYPLTVLLGMTYLQHVEFRENNGVLSLSRSW